MDQVITQTPKKSGAWIWVILIIIVLAAGGYFAWKYFFTNQTEPTESTTAGSTKSTTAKNSGKWQEGGVAIPGQFADADVVDIGSGKYRMYYSTEPEVQGNSLEVYSATSTDGVTWTKEDGVRKTMATFPDVVKMPDGPSTDSTSSLQASSGQVKWRMYFQNAGVIKSATSADGLTWTDEPGTRVDKDESGYNLESVGAQTTAVLDDGTYIMLYRGTIPEAYQTTEKIPNQTTQLYFWALSKDGLTFQKEGLAIDSRNEILYGLADGADLVKWNENEWRVYFWSYAGVYHSVYGNNAFSAPVFDYTNSTDTQMKFSPNPPSDPSVIKIGDIWYMYYGVHTKGIYWASLK